MKYFVLSDIHGFYEEMIESLKIAQYSPENPEHTLIVCGDVFDRGNEALRVFKYLSSIPKERLILIKGNHESLFFYLLNKQFPEECDFLNGTVDTFCQIAHENPDELNEDTYNYNRKVYLQKSRLLWKKIVDKVKKHPITKWLQSDEWKNYYELDKYIFVHSFIIPFMKDWRNANDDWWFDAMWGCPWKQYKAGLFDDEEKQGKVLVCGHWHTSDFFKNLKYVYTYERDCAPIYFSKGLIGLDGGCLYSVIDKKLIHKQNVLVIDEQMKCFDAFGKELVELKQEPQIMTVSWPDINH